LSVRLWEQIDDTSREGSERGGRIKKERERGGEKKE